MTGVKCWKRGCGRSCNGFYSTCCSACPNGHTDQCNRRHLEASRSYGPTPPVASRSYGPTPPVEHNATQASRSQPYSGKSEATIDAKPHLRLHGFSTMTSGIPTSPSSTYSVRGQEGHGVRVLASFPLTYGRLYISAGSVVNFSGDAIVNAANTGCQGGGGVDGAISNAGGAELAAARRALPVLDGRGTRCRTGDAVMTIGGKLAATWCIHAVGPIYGGVDTFKECDELVTNAYMAALRRAQEKKLRSVGFSLLSSGIFRGSQSLEKVLEAGVLGIQAAAYEGLDEVHLVAFNEAEQAELLRISKKLLGGNPAAMAPPVEAASASASLTQEERPATGSSEGSQQSTTSRRCRLREALAYAGSQLWAPKALVENIKWEKKQDNEMQKKEREEIERLKEEARKRDEVEIQAELLQLKEQDQAGEEHQQELRRKKELRKMESERLQKILESIAIERQQEQRQYRAELLREVRSSSAKYLLLPKEHVLGTQLSDHLPQVFVCGGAVAGRIRVLTWNVMTQCRYNSHSNNGNNGFGKSERGDEYFRRLQDIAQVVGLFFEHGGTDLPKVAALQECPLEEGSRALIRDIQRNFPSIEYKIHQTSPSFANITLCDRSQWRLQQTTTCSGLLTRALITNLVPVQGPVLCPPCKFINVHLEWSPNPGHAAVVADAVGNCLEDDGLVVVVGDFNLNVEERLGTLLPGGVVVQIPDSSQVWKTCYDAPNTVDAVIWSEGRPSKSKAKGEYGDQENIAVSRTSSSYSSSSLLPEGGEESDTVLSSPSVSSSSSLLQL